MLLGSRREAEGRRIGSGGGRAGQAREVEARRARGVGDEERGYREVELVGEVAGEEITQDPRAAFDQDTHYAPFGQIVSMKSRDSGSPASMSTALSLSRARARASAGVAQ